MTDPAEPDLPLAEQTESFYSGALRRISRFMLAVAILAIVPLWIRYGPAVCLGFACGCGVAYLNFVWLKRVISGLADRITRTGDSRSGKGIVLRFLLRYALMGIAAYVIFTVSPASLYGLFAGLFLPVAAIACEAAYEVYVALVRGL
ncbi:MAG TPA: ATP synthase subunit I [Terriglobales bacterium]|nr:ATP synthase subunit I [Terriglobales bacterium]